MSERPKLLDLFAGAGGAARGYQQAGFYVVGVDIKPQPHYAGDDLVQADALDFLDGDGWVGFDAIHASPPCQFASVLTPMAYRDRHLNLIPNMRNRLIPTGVPFVIENVENARRHLRQPLMLCGTMFGLPLWRHRYFEMGNQPTLFLSPMACNHEQRPVLVSGTTRRKDIKDGRRFEFSVAECRAAMQIDWMTRVELDGAIPPAYTEFIGLQLRRYCYEQAMSALQRPDV